MMCGQNIGSNKTWQRIPEGSVGVELGVWEGISSERFLKRAKHLHLVDSWSINPYKDSDEHGGYEQYLNRYKKKVGSQDPRDFQKLYDTVFKEVTNKFKDQPVTIYRMSTTDFFRIFTEVVDWVYVDASHSYEGCLQDLKNSLKIIKKGGYIFGDDYTNKKGVKAAVDEFVNQTGLAFSNFYLNQFEIKI